jgi:hypothetical protein
MRGRVRKLLALAAGGLAIVVIASCRYQTAITPPRIHYGEDI